MFLCCLICLLRGNLQKFILHFIKQKRETIKKQTTEINLAEISDLSPINDLDRLQIVFFVP